MQAEAVPVPKQAASSIWNALAGLPIGRKLSTAGKDDEAMTVA